MADDPVLTEEHDGGIVLLRLNRPPMNPLSRAMLASPTVTLWFSNTPFFPWPEFEPGT